MKSFMKFLFIPLSVFSFNTFSASQDECSIWLCLPGGFPAGCSGAHSAMIDRIKDGKSPLPSFSSCAIDDGNAGLSHKYSYAAYIPQHEVCIKTVMKYVNGYYHSVCVKTKTVPEEYRKGTRCQIYRPYKDADMIHSPEYCSRTVKYIDVFQDGKMMGDTYYFN